MSEGAIKAGSLRHRVRFEKNTQATRNDYGEFAAATWTEVDTVWADVRPVGGSEVSEADRVEGRTVLAITTHRRGDITPAMRAVMIGDGNRVLEIASIADTGGQHRGMRLIAHETDGEVSS